MSNILDLSSSFDFNNNNVVKGEIEIDDVFELENNIEILVQDKIVEPTREIQTVTVDEDYDQLGTVTVNPIPDEYIIPDGTLDVDANGDVDVTMFRMARVGVYTPPTLQDKSITITENGTTNIIADEGYDGLSSVDIMVTAAEDLVAEVTVQNEEITEQEVSIEDIKQALNGKSAYKKYAPRYISFRGYTGTELDEEVRNLDTSNITTMKDMFYNNQSLNKIDLSKWDTSKVKYMNYMFYQCNKLVNLDVSNFDISNVMYTDSMFYYCTSLTSLDLSSFGTSKIQSANYMFERCSKLQSLDLSNFDTSGATETTMSWMFNYCSALTNLNLSNFGTSKVTYMNYMFGYCSALTNLDLSSFDTRNVLSMESMFYGCSSLTSLDLSSFSTDRLLNTQNMFSGCSKLMKLDMRTFVFDKLSTYGNMFRNVPVNCEIIVRDEAAKTWLNSKFATLTNVKTVAELEG